MPRNQDMTTISIAVSVENRDILGEYAAQKGFKIISDYIRSVIETDMRANGVKIDLSVDRGGYRVRGSGSEEKKENE